MQQFDRRRALATAGSGLALAVAGCLGGSESPAPADLPGHVRPEDDPPAVPPALSCDRDRFERHPLNHPTPAWGETSADGEQPQVAMRVERLSYDYGERLSVSFTNVGDEELVTGNQLKYNVEVKTEAGWQDVRGTPADEPIFYNSLAVTHEPGEGFEWSLELTESGLVRDHTIDALDVCPDLQTGRYRFVYWDPAVAVAFDLRR